MTLLIGKDKDLLMLPDQALENVAGIKAICSNTRRTELRRPPALSSNTERHLPCLLAFLLLTLSSSAKAQSTEEEEETKNPVAEFAAVMTTNSIGEAVDETAKSSLGTTGAHVHPMFKPSPEDIKRYMNFGKSLFAKGKKKDDVLQVATRTPSWVRGSKSKDTNNSIVCLGYNGMGYTLSAFKSAGLYENTKLPDDTMLKGAVLKQLDFLIILNSGPKVRSTRLLEEGDYKVSGNGAVDEVVVSKIILSDDKGGNFRNLNQSSW